MPKSSYVIDLQEASWGGLASWRYMIDERPLRIIFFSRELCPYFMDFSKKKKNTTENPPFYCHALYIAGNIKTMGYGCC